MADPYDVLAKANCMVRYGTGAWLPAKYWQKTARSEIEFMDLSGLSIAKPDDWLPMTPAHIERHMRERNEIPAATAAVKQ